MPLYIYRNEKTGKTVEVLQPMNAVHEYSENGVKFDRVFLSPLTSIDTRMDPFSKKDFMRRTRKKMTYGDMQDESAQLSEKRAAIAGVDPIKQKLFDDYKNKTGKDHPEDKPKKIETDRYVLEL